MSKRNTTQRTFYLVISHIEPYNMYWYIIGMYNLDWYKSYQNTYGEWCYLIKFKRTVMMTGVFNALPEGCTLQPVNIRQAMEILAQIP